MANTRRGMPQNIACTITGRRTNISSLLRQQKNTCPGKTRQRNLSTNGRTLLWVNSTHPGTTTTLTRSAGIVAPDECAYRTCTKIRVTMLTRGQSAHVSRWDASQNTTKASQFLEKIIISSFCMIHYCIMSGYFPARLLACNAL